MKMTNCRTVEGRWERYQRNEPSELWRSIRPEGKKTHTSRTESRNISTTGGEGCTSAFSKGVNGRF